MSAPRLPLPLPLARSPRRVSAADPGSLPLFAPIIVPAAAIAVPPSSPPSPVPPGQSALAQRHPRLERWTVWRDRVDVEAGIAWIRRRHPEKTAEHLSAATGIPLETARKMLGRETLPHARTLLVMIPVYGPAFLAALYDPAPAWLVELSRALERAELEAAIAADEADLARRRRQLATLGLEALRAAPAGALR